MRDRRISDFFAFKLLRSAGPGLRLPVQGTGATLSGVTLIGAIALVLCGLIGCGPPDTTFRLNEVYLINQERTKQAEIQNREAELGDILTAMFGTPDDPAMPQLGELDYSSVIDINKLKVAAGSVHSDESGRSYGLYREHCAHCHGVTGDGAGPTAAFLNPYPRDYRSGIFKFKSTPKGQRPTHDDLERIVYNGIPGTAMPSFKVLADNEQEALIHYVRYLSVRGEVERLLLQYAAEDLDKEKPIVSASGESQAADLELLRTYAAESIQRWIDADAQAVPVPKPDPNRDMDKSIARGRELFYGPVANCIKCHGESALGDGQTTDFDDWTKELEPLDHAALAQYLDAGALPPRNIRPRNLRLGVFRGGMRPMDLYWRIRNGIDGTPMPGTDLKPDDAGPEVIKLNNADVWSLIDYVRSLSYESISKPAMPESIMTKESL